MEVPGHGKIWQIPRPSLWWKARNGSPEGGGDAERGAEGAGWVHPRGAAPSELGDHPRPGYAASNASTSSSTSSITTPVGSLHSPLVRDGNTRPSWMPTALPPLGLDGGLKKAPGSAEAKPNVPLEGSEGKDTEDTASIASSTHFTVVGVGGYGGGRGGARGLKTGKITVLVLSMSLLILIGILAAILFLEVRARNIEV